jgi:DNA polymerase IV
MVAHRRISTGMKACMNDKLGDFSVTFGSVLGKYVGSKVISPTWRPEGIRNVEVE